MVSQGLPWWASRREGMVRDAKGGPTVPQRNRLIVDNKLPLSSMPINTMLTMRFVEYMFFFVKVNLTCTQFPHFRKHWFVWNTETQGPCDWNQLLWWQDRWICVTSWCGFVSLSGFVWPAPLSPCLDCRDHCQGGSRMERYSENHCR